MSDHPASGAPDYFALFQSMFAPPGAANAPATAASNMFAMLDPKELEKKIGELETVLNWLKATTGMVEMSIDTMKYQRSLLLSIASATETRKPSPPQPDAQQNIEEFAKMAGNMNPALWAMNMMQQAPAAKAKSKAQATPRSRQKKAKS